MVFTYDGDLEMTPKLYINKIDTTIGNLWLASTDKGLAIISFGKNGKSYFDSMIEKDFKDYEIKVGKTQNRETEKQLKSYLAGKLKKFTLKLDWRGTPFQIKSLKRVAKIPYGKVSTYGSIAAAIGHPKAFRAVGSANAGNRLPLVIPCHRVLAANGLGGYGGEVSLKRRLLKMEGVETDS